MEKICPICNTSNIPISANLSDKELYNLHELNIAPQICKSCYIEILTKNLASTKKELIPLKEQKEITQKAYYEAYSAWDKKAYIYKALDYNLSIINYETEKKRLQAIKALEKGNNKKEVKPKPLNIKSLAEKILSNLSIEQQEAIMKNFNLSSLEP